MQGGVGAYTSELAHALVDLGVQASVLTSRPSGIAPVPSHHVPVYPLVQRWDWSIWPTIYAKAAEVGADWIHVQYQTAAFGMNPAINFAPLWWRRKRSQGQPTPSIAWTYHDLLVPYLFPKAGDTLRRWVTEWPATRCDFTVVTNEGDRFQLARKGSSIPRLQSIPIGSNIEGVRLSEEERQQRRIMRGYKKADLVLAYFGFLNRSKGGKALIQTLHRLAQQQQDLGNVYLLMIGERVGASDVTNYAYLQEVEALIAELGLTAHVQWTGHQPQAEVSADLNACDVLVMPYADGASLRRGTLMAGLANGCAIVTTTPQAPLPELVDGEDLCYVAYEPPEKGTQGSTVIALAEAVRRLVSQPELMARLRVNAYRKSQLFSWQTIAQQHLDGYHEGISTEH